MALSVSKKIEITLAIGLFLTGVSIYLLWRDEHILIHRLMAWSGADSFISPLRNGVKDIPLPEWVRFAFPDGLWAMSYILLIDACVKRGYLLTAVIPALGILSELMQLAGWLPGTFDPADLLAYSLPYLIYVLIINK